MKSVYQISKGPADIGNLLEDCVVASLGYILTSGTS